MKKVLRFSLMIIAFILPLLSYMAESAEQKEVRVAMPSRVAAERFVDNGDGTVTDTRRKIMWQKMDNGKEVTFQQAQEYCRILRLGGHADWHLPKPDEPDTAVVLELMMPLHARDALARFDLYWSSDPTLLLPFNYRPARGTEVSRVFFASEDSKAFVRAVRSLGDC